METLEIIKGNYLIAQFLEYEDDGYGDDEPKRFFVHDHLVCTENVEPWESSSDDWNSWLFPEQMLFHSSWDWLMPVVEKCLTISVESEEYEIHYAFIHDALWSINIKSAFYEVVEFIKWYNSCQKEK